MHMSTDTCVMGLHHQQQLHVPYSYEQAQLPACKACAAPPSCRLSAAMLSPQNCACAIMCAPAPKLTLNPADVAPHHLKCLMLAETASCLAYSHLLIINPSTGCLNLQLPVSKSPGYVTQCCLTEKGRHI